VVVVDRAGVVVIEGVVVDGVNVFVVVG